jgi:hypothetical protein
LHQSFRRWLTLKELDASSLLALLEVGKLFLQIRFAGTFNAILLESATFGLSK